MDRFVFGKDTLRKHYHSMASIYCPGKQVRLKLHGVSFFVNGVSDSVVSKRLSWCVDKRKTFTIENMRKSTRQIIVFFVVIICK